MHTLGRSHVRKDTIVRVITEQWENDIDDAFTRGQHNVQEAQVGDYGFYGGQQ